MVVVVVQLLLYKFTPILVINCNFFFFLLIIILKITISERTSHEQYLFLVQSFLARESILKYVVKTKVIVKLPS